MAPPDFLSALAPIVDAFERLTVPYAVAGSVASSAHGIARATLDVDLVAELEARHVQLVYIALHDAYHIERRAVSDAVARRGTFSVVHLATMLKVDVYVLPARRFDQESFHRRRRMHLDDARSYFVGSAEDTILHKLEWYRAGGEASERHWADVLGVMRVQGQALDVGYLRGWAGELGVTDLLVRAQAEAGVGPP